MRRVDYHSAAVGVLIALLVSTSGCGTSSAPVEKQGGVHLKALLSLYIVAGRELGHRPRSEEEFRKFIQDQGPELLERLNVTSVDELFVSTRNGKPLIVVYGSTSGKAASDVVAYESEGVDGMRQVGDVTGRVRVLNAEEFAALGLP